MTSLNPSIVEFLAQTEAPLRQPPWDRMEAVKYQDRFVRDPEVCGGETLFKGTRVPLRTVHVSLADGDSIEILLTEFPTQKPRMSADELLQEALQLDQPDLDRLILEIVAFRAQQRVPHLSKSEA